jgi:3-phosphoshikimate 1-carboxyvinyltransferase
MATELAKLGVKTKELPDTLIIEGDPQRANLTGAAIDTHDDHRIAMCFAVAGLVIPGVTIVDEGCVGKSFPDFWTTFAELK